MSGILPSCAEQLAAYLVICLLNWINSVKQICVYNYVNTLCNQLVSIWLSDEATFLNCGNILRAFSTTSSCESRWNTQGNDLGHSNNEKDWTICSQAPKCANASIRGRFRDYNGVGLRELATLGDNLRDSPCFRPKSEVECVGGGGLAYSNWDVLSSQKNIIFSKNSYYIFIIWINQ